MIVGGLIFLVGIVNPPRRPGEVVRRDPHGPSALVHPCPQSRQSERPEPAVTA